ncbi:MAG: hypothetical protein FJ253_07640, partial [Phycisphaerae bacterium]|nr:hypothetical protein [Phycisphaerae bacterium]
MAYQDIGTLSVGSPIVLCGSVGTWGTASRDLDWYRFTLSTGGTINFSVLNRTMGGAGDPAPNITMFILSGDDCDTQVTEFAAASPDCPFTSPDINLPAGNHVVIVTVNAFAPDLPACEVAYVATLTKVADISPACGTGGDCVTATPGVPGCINLDVCACTCAILFNCCDTEWDDFCVQWATENCGAFAYSCDKPVYANDCATDGADLPISAGAPTAFDITGANTDGPPNDCDYDHDVWYVVQSPGNGQLTIIVDTPTFDSVVALYVLGASPDFDPNELPSMYIGCVDAFGAGGEGVVLIDAVADEYYLVQVSGFAGEQGAGTIEAFFDFVIYYSGNNDPVLFRSTGAGTFPDCNGAGPPTALTNLGWSSGENIGTFPQRRAAAAFTVPDPGEGFASWKVTGLVGLGFTPGGAIVNERLVGIIYNRTSLNTAPTDADQVAVIDEAYPTPYDYPGGGTNEAFQIAADVDLTPGDYWLTLYASNASPTTTANWAWFTNAAEGIYVVNPADSEPMLWRSTAWPVPGFAVYQLSKCVLLQSGALDPLKRYTPAHVVLGTKVPCPP